MLNKALKWKPFKSDAVQQDTRNFTPKDYVLTVINS
jgi:hypothetical protein